jgi:tetratricopeptide (TPR) repeat protein
MRRNPTGQTLFTLALIVCGFAVIFGLSRFNEANRPVLPEGFEDEDLALQGARLKGYSLGFEGLIADWYWMKSMQYIGDKLLKSEKGIGIDNMRELNPRLLYPYLNNATDLDPQFISVYEYGAMVLPAIDEARAIELLEKGIAQNPKSWRLYHYLGYIHWQLKNYDQASEIYAAGAKIEGAPEWMRLMSAKTKTEGDSRETARAIYRQVFEEAQDAQTKENAALRLLQIDSLEEQDVIRAALRTFQSKNNRCANNWSEILMLLKGGNAKIRLDQTNNLIDPTNAPYVLDKENCDVRLDFEKTKIPSN